MQGRATAVTRVAAISPLMARGTGSAGMARAAAVGQHGQERPGITLWSAASGGGAANGTRKGGRDRARTPGRWGRMARVLLGRHAGIGAGSGAPGRPVVARASRRRRTRERNRWNG